MEFKPAQMDPEVILSLFNEVARGSPIIISAVDREGKLLLQLGKGLEALGMQPNQFVGTSVFDVFAGAEDSLARIRGALAGETSGNCQEFGGAVWDSWYSPLRNNAGELVGAMVLSTDVTERERNRIELEQRLAIIEAQTQAIRQLAVPIIQVWEGVLVVPVIGEIDADRAGEIMERLLAALVANRARHAILDLTGVDAIDTRTADQFMKILGAVALLGASGIISGIRPAVAQALVGIGVDLGRVTTVATLHDALRRCMNAGS